MALKRISHTFESTGTDQLNQRQNYLPPGVYYGYDFPSPAPSDMTLVLDMVTTGMDYVDDTKPTPQVIRHGMCLTGQRIMIQETQATSASDASIVIPDTGASTRVDAIIIKHKRTTTGGGEVLPTYARIDTGGLTDVDSVKALLDIDETLLGILELPINCTSLDTAGVKYTKVLAQPAKRNATVLGTIGDFDNETQDGIKLAITYTATNAPPFTDSQTNPVLLQVFATQNSSEAAQVATDMVNRDETYIRYYNGTAWSPWTRYSVDIVDNFVSTSTSKAASANTVRILNNLITALDSRVTDNENDITTIFQDILDLENDKLDIADIVNNFTTSTTNQAASANTVRILNNRIDELENVTTDLFSQAGDNIEMPTEFVDPQTGKQVYSFWFARQLAPTLSTSSNAFTGVTEILGTIPVVKNLTLGQVLVFGDAFTNNVDVRLGTPGGGTANQDYLVNLVNNSSDTYFLGVRVFYLK